MITRLGKIAQLPKSIRHELNQRLDNGKQGPELVEWLNSLPETQELIAQKFDNQPITRSNLSDWRHGGFLDWHTDQIREARFRRICETGGSLEQAESGDLFENFARITVAEMVVDLDAVQKLRGEKRAERMHKLVRDLARLQNAYNRSRWAALAWTKYNDTLPAKPSEPELRSPNFNLPSPSSQLPTATPSSPTPIVPDRSESQAAHPDDPEPKPDGNGMYALHFTNCNCKDPCPKCHAPDSAYPLEDAIRDHNFERRYHEYPCDRRGKRKFLMNFICDCPCDRCAEKTNPPLLLPPPAEPESGTDIGRVELPLNPIIRHAESRDEIPSVNADPTPPLPPTHHISPLRPLRPIPPAQLADFSRRMALLKTAS